MRAFILASTLALAAASANAAPAKPSIIINADWLQKPTSEDLQDVWPKDALVKRQEGRAVIECQLSPAAVVSDCKVLSEEPAGAGFGAAAVQAAQRFKMKPATRDGKPIASTVRVPLDFRIPSPATAPTFLQQPSSDDLDSVWPKAAIAKKLGGKAVIECVAVPAGSLTDCKVVSEEPAGLGFGAAALQLAPRFLMNPAMQDGKPIASTVRIPVSFDMPDSTYVEPDWLKMPDSDALNAVWPKAALLKGESGSATIECEVEPQGTLEGCKVISEAPPGEGFGASTLLLAPSFLMKPATKDGRPVRSKVRIPINFKIDDGEGEVPYEKLSIIPDPIWDSAPSFDDMKAAWPSGAKAAEGHVSMRCQLAGDGTLHHCDVLTETPRGEGFAKAAKTLVASKFRLRATPASASKIAKAYVNLAVHFNNPALNTPRAVVEPKWITLLDPAKVQAIYPTKAADAGVKSGKGFADCAVAPDGHLVDCKPSGAAPEGLGFAEAAVQVASVMQMNPWTGGGGPVDGVRIRLPVAFNLAQDASASAPTPARAPAKP